MTELLEKRIKEVVDAVENGVVVQADAQFLLQMLTAQGDKIAELEASYYESLEQIEKLERALEFYAQTKSINSPGSWDMRKKFIFDMICVDDLEYIGPEYGPKKKRYVFGGKNARQALAELEKWRGEK